MTPPGLPPHSLDRDIPRPRLHVVDVHGTGEAAGEVYGEQCRSLIVAHHERVLQKLEQQRGLSRDDVHARALAFRAATARDWPDLAAEVDGVAAGAGLPRAGGWLLQVRAEVAEVAAPECTSLVLLGGRTATGAPLVGLNADLPPMYASLLVLLRRTFPDRPALLTVTPAGQLGHHGLNSHGVTVVANFLHSPGWRHGVPRYLLTRIALAQRTAGQAADAVERVRRAASRNLLIVDDHQAIDIEMTPTASARLAPHAGALAHTNHFRSELDRFDTADERWLHNSRTRQARVEHLLASMPTVTLDNVAAILRDRRDVPHAICHHARDSDVDIATVASSIIDVAERRLWTALGAPDTTAYVPYEMPVPATTRTIPSPLSESEGTP